MIDLLSAETKNVHFIGLCGAGMSAVAKLMADRGWQVTGSDEGFYPPVSEMLEREGFTCLSPHAADNIPEEAAVIVIGKHAKLLPETNTEVARAFALQDEGKAVILSYPQVLHALTRDSLNIVVTGSFGKSTTTALITLLLSEAGRDPSFFMGAVPKDFPANAGSGEGELFVLEGDEYPAANFDPTSKFMFYNASVVVFTSGEHDHVNIFPTLESYLAPYRELARSLRPEHVFVTCATGAHTAEIAAETRAKVVTYAVEAPADYIARDIRGEAGWTHFRLVVRGEDIGEFRTPLIGDHNVENIVGAMAAARESVGLGWEEMRLALTHYHGLRRRLEDRTDDGPIPVYEDLASSRAKAMAGLRALRAHFPDRRLVAIFQPHTFSFRSRSALHWYPGMFADVDELGVFLPPSFGKADDPNLLTGDEIYAAIRDGNACPSRLLSDEADTEAFLRDKLSSSSVLLIMTSGGMGGLVESAVTLSRSLV
jgi:UDP-N-acetylmuramate: L-alanyl-gamma-D-glutamyl-meso-diaminopimelate ligase